MSDSFERSQVKLPLLGERAGVRASLSQTELLVPRCFQWNRIGYWRTLCHCPNPGGPLPGEWRQAHTSYSTETARNRILTAKQSFVETLIVCRWRPSTSRTDNVPLYRRIVCFGLFPATSYPDLLENAFDPHPILKDRCVLHVIVNMGLRRIP